MKTLLSLSNSDKIKYILRKIAIPWDPDPQGAKHLLPNMKFVVDNGL